MKVFVLMYCLVQSQCAIAPSCKLMGAFNTAKAAQDFADDLCGSDAKCSKCVSIEELDVLSPGADPAVAATPAH